MLKIQIQIWQSNKYDTYEYDGKWSGEDFCV